MQRGQWFVSKYPLARTLEDNGDSSCNENRINIAFQNFALKMNLLEIKCLMIAVNSLLTIYFFLALQSRINI
jgi:hypothetical protein